LTITGLDDALALYGTRDEALRAAFTARDSSRAEPAPGSP
jgi:hypothetical protein